MKKLLLILLSLQLMLFSGGTALAASGAETQELSNSEQAPVAEAGTEETNQAEGPAKEENTQPPQDESSNSEGEGQPAQENPPSSQTQEDYQNAQQENEGLHQETNTGVQQNQELGTSNQENVQQEQTIDGKIQQDQPNTDEQTQETELNAEQRQNIGETSDLKAEQSQNTEIESNQSGNQEYENARASAKQEQSIDIEGEIDYAEQGQEAHLKIKQKSTLSEELNLVDVKADENQGVETTGTGSLEQTQSVEVDGNLKYDGKEEEISLRAATKNAIEIIKDVGKTIVKIFQKITFNDNGNKAVNTFEGEFTLDEHPVENSMTFSKIFDWGILSIFNRAKVNHSDDENELKAEMVSSIFFDFFEREDEPEPDPGEAPSPTPNPGTKPNPKPETPGKNQEPKPISKLKTKISNPVSKHGTGYIPSNRLKDSDGDWLLDQTEIRLGTDPYNPDTDGDKISDYLEVVKFETDPLKEDTDEDQLTDFFEIIYHTPNEPEHFEIMCMEFADITRALHEMEYDPKKQDDQEKDSNQDIEIKLNPLKKDTDENGIEDNLEDFDGDKINNEDEQEDETNPYDKSDEPACEKAEKL